MAIPKVYDRSNKIEQQVKKSSVLHELLVRLNCNSYKTTTFCRFHECLFVQNTFMFLIGSLCLQTEIEIPGVGTYQYSALCRVISGEQVITFNEYLMLTVSSTQIPQRVRPQEIVCKNKVHIHITTEGYKYIAGGNGVFVNTFCKAFSDRTCRNIMVMPLLEFEYGVEDRRSISDGYTFACGEVVLVERCSDIAECDVYRIQPADRKKRYFEKHVSPSDIAPGYKEVLAKEVMFKECQGINGHNLRSAAAISLKICVFNKLAAKFVNQVLMPTLGNEDVYVHDHFFGGSLQYIHNSNNLRKINWVHCLTPHVGFSDIMSDQRAVYPTEVYLTMGLRQLEQLPDDEKPVRERAIKHADAILTVSKYAQSFLAKQHVLISKFLSMHKKEIVAIKSYSDLSKFDLSVIARKYGLGGVPKKAIKAKLKDDFFAGRLPVYPPCGSGMELHKELPIIFFMGRPSPEKGTQHVLNMVKTLDCLFFIVSNGMDHDYFIQEVCKLREKRKNLLLLTKNQEHKQLLMAIADYAVIPSLAESLGLIAGECNAMGLHVIISDVGGLPESSPPCDKCRTIVHSDARYGLFSEETDRRFLLAVKKKLNMKESFNQSHIARHARYFHSREQYIASIKTVLYKL